MITVQTNTSLVLAYYSELMPFVPVVGDTYVFTFINKMAKSQSEEITYTCTVNTGYVCKFEGLQPTDTKNDLNIFIEGVNTNEILRIID
ncbi:hypothetical protein N9251_03435 [Gammaproteobacteria bacterium]|nr:hypothetical protein [Gammaproteobacteria bacterium]